MRKLNGTIVRNLKIAHQITPLRVFFLTLIKIHPSLKFFWSYQLYVKELRKLCDEPYCTEIHEWPWRMEQRSHSIILHDSSKFIKKFEKIVIFSLMQYRNYSETIQTISIPFLSFPSTVDIMAVNFTPPFQS